MWSFFFYLDIISTMTLILDIHWIDNVILGIYQQYFTKKTLNTNFSPLGRAFKIGSRTIRVLRFLRLTRLSRISKLYKIKQKLDEIFAKKKRDSLKATSSIYGNITIMNNDMTYNPNNYNLIPNLTRNNTQMRNSIYTPNTNKNININFDNNETKVARKLSDLILTRVILMILFMIFGIIFFDPNFYFKAESSMEYGLKIFNEFPDLKSPVVNLTFNIYVQEHLVNLIIKY